MQLWIYFIDLFTVAVIMWIVVKPQALSYNLKYKLLVFSKTKIIFSLQVF